MSEKNEFEILAEIEALQKQLEERVVERAREEASENEQLKIGLAIKIKALRAEAHMSMNGLAVALRVTPITVKNMEKEKEDGSWVRGSEIINLCRLFKISADELLGIDFAEEEEEREPGYRDQRPAR